MNISSSASLPTHNVIFANTLRGIAALLVLVSHHWGIFWNDRVVAARFSGLPVLPENLASPYISEILRVGITPINLGALGVSIFFLISGFVIPFSLIHQTRTQFAIARFFRLWPSYFVGFLCTLTCIFIASYSLDRPLPFPVSAIWPHLILGMRGLLQSQSIDAIIWTLEVEFGFYILMALTIKSVSKASLFTFIIPILFLIVAISLAIAGHYVQVVWIYYYIQKLIGFSQFFIFMYIGVALNFYYRKRINSSQVFMIIAGLLFVALMSNVVTTQNWHEIGPSYLLGLILFLAFMFTPTLQSWSPKVAQFFSKISYPLYVIHAVIGYILLYFLVVEAQIEPLFALMATFITVITIALFIHYWIEVPSQRLGKSLASRWVVK